VCTTIGISQLEQFRSAIEAKTKMNSATKTTIPLLVIGIVLTVWGISQERKKSK
jgi:uncharacterized membrane protein YqjE